MTPDSSLLTRNEVRFLCYAWMRASITTINDCVKADDEIWTDAIFRLRLATNIHIEINLEKRRNGGLLYHRSFHIASPRWNDTDRNQYHVIPFAQYHKELTDYLHDNGAIFSMQEFNALINLNLFTNGISL